MPHFDLQGEELRSYRPELAEPLDFDAFWADTLAVDGALAPPVFTPVDNHLRLIDTFDVVFPGFGGSPVRAWLQLPVGAAGPLPAVVEYVGYGGGRGLSHERLLWAAAGYAYLLMDTRGQGSTWSVGDTADPDASGAPAHPGFLTRGILDRRDYYFRRVFVDAVRAVAAAASHPRVDAGRIAVAGTSQGGGLALATAALAPQARYALIDVPFLCDFPRATSIAFNDPYLEIVRYLKVHRDQVATVFETLSYFDGAILARRATAEALFSVALMDETCPPSTVYAAYNWYGGPKSIVEYPFNDHEGGQAHHEHVELEWLAARLGG
jgi:cephalosporin-C deacetylase